MHRSPDGLSHSPSVTRKYTDHISSTTSPRRAPDTRDLALEHHVRWYPAVLVVLLGGYLFFDRAFAHAHVPGTPIFLAEPVLAIGVVLAANSIEGRRLIRFSTPIRALIGFMLWGLVLLIVHVFDHGVDAVQDSALWYYGLFAIVVGTLVLTWRIARSTTGHTGYSRSWSGRLFSHGGNLSNDSSPHTAHFSPGSSSWDGCD